MQAGDKIVLTYSKDSSSASGSDIGYIGNISISILTRVQVGTETKDVARKIKKAYIGIGGVARPCFGGGTPAYYGQIDALKSGVRLPSTASVGDYALFAGGYSPYYYTEVTPDVTAYNSSLVRSYPSTITGVADASGASVGDYAIFHGGVCYDEDDSEYWNTYNYCYAYNNSLTQSSQFTGLYRFGAASGSIGNYALFAGGRDYDYNMTKTLFSYDASLTSTTLSATLKQNQCYMRSFHAGNYLLFTGGENSDTICQAFDSSLTKYGGTINITTHTRSNMAASVGQYGIVITPASYSGTTSAIDIFDASLTRITGTVSATTNYDFIASMTLEDYAFFIPDKSPTSLAGPQNTNTLVFDSSLTQTQLLPPQNTSLWNHSTENHLNNGITVGNFALIGGGVASNGYGFKDTVEAYTII